MTGPSPSDPHGVRPCSVWWLGTAAIGPLVVLIVGVPLDLLARLLYVAPAVAVGLAAVAGVRAWRARAAPVPLWPGLLSALALVAIVFAVSPPALRVQFDETSLVSVAQGMHDQRLAVTTTGAVPFDGEHVPVENIVDKRPPLFPFLVSLLHDVTGARLGNAFAVNGALLALGLVLVFALVRPRLGLVAACAGQVLVVSVPLVAVVATAAGFELLATVLLLLTVLAALGFVQRPDAVRAQWLLAVCGLLGQARYESLPAAAIVLGLAWFGARRRSVLTRGTVAQAFATGILLAPVIGQLLHARDANFYPEAGGAPLVAFAHFAAHLPRFVADLFAPSLANPLPGVTAWLGAAGFAVWLARRRLPFAALLFAVPVVGLTLLTLAWFFGDVRQPAALRLFLPVAWTTALLPLLLLLPVGRRAAAWLLLVAALVLAALRLGEVARGTAFPSLANAELARAIAETAAAVDTADRGHTLWVATTAQHLIVHGHAALSPDAFVRQAPVVQPAVRSGQVRTIYVLETPLDASFAPAFGDPRRLLATAPSQEVYRSEAAHLVVHRLRLR